MIKIIAVAGFLAFIAGIYYLIGRGQKMKREMGERYMPPSEPKVSDWRGRGDWT